METLPPYHSLVQSLLPYDPEKIILIGSHARGEADAYSDLDLIIIKKTASPFIKRLEEIVPYINIAGKCVQAFVYTPQELEAMQAEDNPFLSHALQNSKVLYEKPS